MSRLVSSRLVSSRLVSSVALLIAGHTLGCAPEGNESIPILDHRYEREVHLSGLGETVLLVKTPRAGWVEYADGHRTSMASVLLAEERILHERYGALDERLRDRMDVISPKTQISIAVKYYRQPNDAATQSEADYVEAALRRAGIVVKSRSSITTLLFADATPEFIERITNNPRVEWIFLDEPVAVTALDATDPVPYTQADISAWIFEPLFWESRSKSAMWKHRPRVRAPMASMSTFPKALRIRTSNRFVLFSPIATTFAHSRRPLDVGARTFAVSQIMRPGWRA